MPRETCKQRTFRTSQRSGAAASSTGAARVLRTLHDYDGSTLVKRHRRQLILLSTTPRGPHLTTPGQPGARSIRPCDLTHKECSPRSHPQALHDAGRSQRTLRVGLTATARRPEPKRVPITDHSNSFHKTPTMLEQPATRQPRDSAVKQSRHAADDSRNGAEGQAARKASTPRLPAGQATALSSTILWKKGRPMS